MESVIYPYEQAHMGEADGAEAADGPPGKRARKSEPGEPETVAQFEKSSALTSSRLIGYIWTPDQWKDYCFRL